jgi:hypothetical protein
MIYKPIEVEAVGKYSIYIKFADNTEGQIDLSHLINKPIFQNWTNPDFFKKVYIDTETYSIAWDENIELCPDNLYLKIKGLSFEEWKNKKYSDATN